MSKEDAWMIQQEQPPDRFFSAVQQQQLTRLMAEWRRRRDQGKLLPANFQAELEALIEAELLASAARTTAMLDDLTP